MSQKDEMYLAYEETTDKFHIRVYRPILTEEERARRMKAIEKAAADLLLASERAKNKLTK